MATLFLRKKQPDGTSVVIPIRIEVRGHGTVTQPNEKSAEAPQEKKEVSSHGLPR
jgi:hypothetical protein